MSNNDLLGTLSIAIALVAYGIYIWQIVRRGLVVPHPFSWLLWALVTSVAFFAQLARSAGPGSWVTGLTAVVCGLISGLALGWHGWRFSRLDWAALCVGLCVFGYYVVTRDPEKSAVLATLVDVVGYYPTVRKGWADPVSESRASFALNGLKFAPALLAMESFSVATSLYPLTILIANLGVATTLAARRRALRVPGSKPASRGPSGSSGTAKATAA